MYIFKKVRCIRFIKTLKIFSNVRLSNDNRNIIHSAFKGQTNKPVGCPRPSKDLHLCDVTLADLWDVM